MSENRVILSVFLLLSFASVAALAGPNLKANEEVILFRTSANLDANGASWAIPVHGWVFQHYRNPLKGQFFKILANKLEFDKNEVLGNAHFQERGQMFFVDNQGGKRVEIQLGDDIHTMNESSRTGHFRGTIHLTREDSGAVANASWLRYTVVPPEGDSRRIEGETQLVPAEGVSVISDIDDTIKDTIVLKERTKHIKTFLEPFEVIPGMVDVYKAWADQGAVFHYVSGSPWRLYPPLAQLLDDAGFPRGAFHLKLKYTLAAAIFNKTAETKDFKIEIITSIFEQFPKRTFVLVGDAGEFDADVYGIIARKYPDRVRHIYVRRVKERQEKPGRYEAAFQDVPEDRWTVFDDPTVLSSLDLSQ